MRNLLRYGTTLMVALSFNCPQASISAESSDESDCAATASLPAECKITMVDTRTESKETQQVLDVLQSLVKALNNRDWKAYADNIDEHCTTFDDRHKLISGKENVVEDMRERSNRYAKQGAPFVSVTIDQPYAVVKGDSAVVTFVAIRQFGGKHPFKEVANATDVFVKQGDCWKKCHFRGSWKRV